MGQYLNQVTELLANAAAANEGAVSRGAVLLADSIATGGVVYVFGSGHSQLLALEVHHRAGGLVPVQAIYDPTFGRAEQVEGFAPCLLGDDDLRSGDALVVVSNSGRNAAPIEVALLARERHVPVIALTAVGFSRSLPSRHSSGKRLFELADVVLDTMVPPGDAIVRLQGLGAPVGPASTVIGAALLNELMVETVRELLRRGIEPPVLRSQNLDDSDEYNRRVVQQYGARVRRVL